MGARPEKSECRDQPAEVMLDKSGFILQGGDPAPHRLNRGNRQRYCSLRSSVPNGLGSSGGYFPDPSMVEVDDDGMAPAAKVGTVGVEGFGGRGSPCRNVEVGGRGEDGAGTDKDKTQKRFLAGHSTRTGKDCTCLYLLTFVVRKLPLSSRTPRTPRTLSLDYLSWTTF